MIRIAVAEAAYGVIDRALTGVALNSLEAKRDLQRSSCGSTGPR
jgi:hypothetical protein